MQAGLQKRLAAGFGDGVAILTATVEGDPHYWSVSLFARSGPKYLAGRYLVGAKKYDNGSPRSTAVDVPEGWPLPKREALLPLLKPARPSEYIASDGAHTWGGSFLADGNPTMTLSCSADSKPDDRSAQMLAHMRRLRDLPGQIWPDLAPYGADSKLQLITDKTRPGQVGLRLEQQVYMKAGVYEREVSLCWLDPGRDDMPLERTSQRYAQDGKITGSEFKTTYLQHKQLPDGRWYPSQWRTTTIDRARGDKIMRDEECHLQLFPGATLEPAWFTNPVERLTHANSN
jgi:hypothetical protein